MSVFGRMLMDEAERWYEAERDPPPNPVAFIHSPFCTRVEYERYCALPSHDRKHAIKAEWRRRRRRSSQPTPAVDLVGCAPSLLACLDEDALAIVRQHVRDDQMSGKWSCCIHSEKVRSDGRLEVSDQSHSIWLRPDGSAQVLSRITWTSYDGETTAAGEYGGGTSHYSIGADRAGSEDEFLRDPATAVAGYWKVCAAQELIEEMETTVNDRQVKASVAALAARNAKAEVLHISGRGRIGGGAVEDDDLHYNGGRDIANLTKVLNVAQIRKYFTRTPAEAFCPRSESACESATCET